MSLQRDLALVVLTRYWLQRYQVTGVGLSNIIFPR